MAPAFPAFFLLVCVDPAARPAVEVGGLQRRVTSHRALAPAGPDLRERSCARTRAARRHRDLRVLPRSRHVRDESLRPRRSTHHCSSKLNVRAKQNSGCVRLQWTCPLEPRSRVFYLVFRSSGSSDTCTYAGSGGNLCILSIRLLGRTAITSFDDTPYPGHYQYRVIASSPTSCRGEARSPTSATRSLRACRQGSLSSRPPAAATTLPRPGGRSAARLVSSGARATPAAKTGAGDLLRRERDQDHVPRREQQRIGPVSRHPDRRRAAGR